MNYEESVAYINSFIPRGSAKLNIHWGLDKVRFLLKQLNNPEKDQVFVHIGGTSGKGSTSTILASILKESGYKTGLHISPHIISITERAQINGKNISEEKFAELIESMKPAIEAVTKEYGSTPSYFELLVALAFLHFKQEKTDINVIEVGLGGKLDATNVITSQHQILTSIGLDHTEILGDTKEKILDDKKEIIKQNSVVVSGIQEENLREIVLKKCLETNSEAFFLNRGFLTKGNSTADFDFYFDDKVISNLHLNIPGEFQVFNSSLAIAMALKLNNQFPNITDETIKQGVKKVSLRGRFDIISKDPLIIFDGAHNPDKIQALIKAIQKLYPDKAFITVFRFKKRKDILQSLNFVSKISSKIIITGSNVPKDNGSDENYDEEDLKFIREHYQVEAIKDSREALEHAKQLQKQNPHLGILATGSIFMLRELY